MEEKTMVAVEMTADEKARFEAFRKAEKAREAESKGTRRPRNVQADGR